MGSNFEILDALILADVKQLEKRRVRNLWRKKIKDSQIFGTLETRFKLISKR